MSSIEIPKTVMSALRQAGVDHAGFSSESIDIHELTGASMVRMHSLLDLDQQATTLIDLPERVGQCTGGNPAILCLRPREWLFISETASPAELIRHVQSTMDNRSTAVWNTSDGLAIFRLSGAGSPWLLSKISGLDYLAGRSAGQHCARTRMGHIAVVVHYHQAADETWVFDLVFDRSLARYLWDLLVQSAPHADELARNFGDAA